MGLNNTDKGEWSRCLSAQLNSKCNKVVAKLSLEENQGHDTSKKGILGEWVVS